MLRFRIGNEASKRGLAFRFAAIGSPNVKFDTAAGMRQWACGGVLWELAWEGAWPDDEAGGDWQTRLRRILKHAYRDFRTYCRTNNIHCSQPKFKPTTLAMTALDDWPLLKSKGFNCGMVSLWLYERCRERIVDTLTSQRATMMFGFALLWHTFRNGSMWIILHCVSHAGGGMRAHASHRSPCQRAETRFIRDSLRQDLLRQKPASSETRCGKTRFGREPLRQDPPFPRSLYKIC